MDWAVAGVTAAREVFLTWNQKCFNLLTHYLSIGWGDAFGKDPVAHFKTLMIKGIFKSFNFHTDKNIYVLLFISNLLPPRD